MWYIHLFCFHLSSNQVQAIKRDTQKRIKAREKTGATEVSKELGKKNKLEK